MKSGFPVQYDRKNIVDTEYRKSIDMTVKKIFRVFFGNIVPADWIMEILSFRISIFLSLRLESMMTLMKNERAKDFSVPFFRFSRDSSSSFRFALSWRMIERTSEVL